jgi:hypothetical protein
MHSAPRLPANSATSPPSPEFEAFRQLVFADAALQAELAALPAGQEFYAATVAVAARRGHCITAEEVRAAHQAGRRGWIERNSL